MLGPGKSLTFLKFIPKHLIEEFSISKQSHGEPFSVLLAGRKHYVFGTPAEVLAVFRKPKILSIAPFIRMIMSRLFGMDKATVQSLDANREDFHPTYDKFLLRPEHFEPVVKKYFKEIRPPFQTLIMDEAVKAKDGVLARTDLFNLLLDTMTRATVMAYLGPKPLEIDPTLCRDMSDFTIYGFWPLFAGVPTYFLPHTSRAKKRVVDAMREGVVNPQIQGKPEAKEISDFSRYQIDYQSKYLAPNSNAVNIFSFMFG